MNYNPQSEETKIRNAKQRRLFLERSSQLPRSLWNKIVIEGFLIEQEQQRFTAAGLPVIRFRLLHLGEQDIQAQRVEQVSMRQVVCTVDVLCIGEKLCTTLSSIVDQSIVRVEGFLTRNAYKDELSWVVVEARSVEFLCA